MKRIIMKTTLLTFALLLVSPIIFGQKGKRFTSEAEMKSVNPDSVYSVELNNYQGESLPEWLFEYKNIEYLNIQGSSETPIPIKDLSGISNFSKLNSLYIGFSSVSEISDELAKMDINLSLPGIKIRTLRPLYQAMVSSNSGSNSEGFFRGYIRSLDGFETTYITDEDEKKMFKKISGNGGHTWFNINGKSVKLTRYIFDPYDVRENKEKLKLFLTKDN
jgi:Leucine-rich repeat (LRR) protein